MRQKGQSVVRIAEMARDSTPDRHRLESCLSAVLFLGLFLYLWQGIKPHLLYYGFGVFAAYPIVSWDRLFLHEAFGTPGGPMGALAALLAHSYSHAWLGALTITVILGALWLGIRRLLQSGHAGRFRDLAWVPLLLALTIYNNYYENPLPVLLTVGLAVWSAILYDALPVRASIGRAGLFLVLIVALYCLAGAAALVLAAIACLTEALLHRRIALALLQIALAAGGAFVVGRFVFDLEPQALFLAGTPWDPGRLLKLSPLANWLAMVLHAFVPSLLLVAFLGQILAETQAKTGTPPGRRRGGPHARQAPRRPVDCRVWTGGRMLAVAMTAALCLAFTRTPARHERMLHYLAQRRDWDQVLALANRMRGRHRFTRSGVFDINRALAHQGRLGSELCVFPQSGVDTLLMTFDDMPGRVMHAKSLELYLDLGCLNAAEKNAYELLAQEGASPPVLEALVRVHLAKGQYEPARVVFQALRRCVGGREYARRWQPLVADPARAETDPLIQSWRKVRLTKDAPSVAFSPTVLANLLDATPGHRLAFEYLMACHLLRNEQAEIIRRLPCLTPLGYTRLPRHYAEALLVHSLKTGRPVEAQGWTIDPDLQRQCAEIRTVVTEGRGDDRKVFDTLVPRYGDTYMFYSMFNLCGLR